MTTDEYGWGDWFWIPPDKRRKTKIEVDTKSVGTNKITPENNKEDFREWHSEN